MRLQSHDIHERYKRVKPSMELRHHGHVRRRCLHSRHTIAWLHGDKTTFARDCRHTTQRPSLELHVSVVSAFSAGGEAWCCVVCGLAFPTDLNMAPVDVHALLSALLCRATRVAGVRLQWSRC